MKRKLFLLGFLLSIMTMPSFAQIEDEIQQSKTEQVRKGREYLTEKFLDRDYEKVKEIKDYLLTFETEEFKAFKPHELWHILLWTQEYEALETAFRQVDSAYVAEIDKAVVPSRDQLGEQLYRRSIEDEHLLRFNLQEANLPAEDFDFLNLYLDWDSKPLNKEHVEECNELADQFLAKYPHSEYEWFVRHIIRRVFAPKNWGWGMGLDLCSGLSSGVLPKPYVGFGLSIDVLYKKFDFMLGYDVVYGKTALDLPYTISSVPHVYPKGSRSEPIVWYANLSYEVWEKKRMSLAPFIGVGGVLEVFPDDQVPGSDLKKQQRVYWTGNVGACFDLKGDLLGDTGALRVKYQCGISMPDGNLSTMHLISVGWTYKLRGKTRVY